MQSLADDGLSSEGIGARLWGGPSKGASAALHRWVEVMQAGGWQGHRRTSRAALSCRRGEALQCGGVLRLNVYKIAVVSQGKK